MRTSRLITGAGKAVAVAALLVWSLLPIAFIVMSSLKPGRDIFAVPTVYVFTPTFQHYVSLWTRWGQFFDGLLNSTVITAGATALAVVASTCAGYVYSRNSGRFHDASVMFLIVVRLIPPIVVTLPLFPVVDRLGLGDTHILLILLYATFWVSLNTMIMKNFFDQIPYELDEAAYVDGASEWQLVHRILARLTLQGMAAGSIFVFVFAWNEYLFAMIFTTNRAKTAPLILSELMGAVDGTEWGVLFAGVTLQLVPVVLLVTLARRYLIAGLAAGAVKG